MEWAGVYTGIIPAASSPGIDVQITLNNDQTFELHYEYLNRDFVYSAMGKFFRDETGLITLDIKDAPPYYRVGNNCLIQLDMNRNTITGDLADNYILRKLITRHGR
ncbi:MAG: copper resistance protein NlpE [Treponema sp.]|nr:copper resistance protein NlpE [Treponema sp.]